MPAKENKEKECPSEHLIMVVLKKEVNLLRTFSPLTNLTYSLTLTLTQNILALRSQNYLIFFGR